MNGGSPPQGLWSESAESAVHAREVHDNLPGRLLVDLRCDVLHGIRVLFNSPGFAAVAILTLAGRADKCSIPQVRLPPGPWRSSEKVRNSLVFLDAAREHHSHDWLLRKVKSSLCCPKVAM